MKLAGLELPDCRPVLPAMFFMFSNRIGCLASLAISIVGTILLLMVLGVVRLG